MPANTFTTVAALTRLTSGTATLTAPVLAANEQIRAGQPCVLEVLRDRDGTSGALDGTVSVSGADLSMPGYYKAGSAWVGQTYDPGAGVAMTFDTDIPFAAFSGNNWIVRVGDDLRPYVAVPAAAGDFTVADNGGLCRVTIGTTTLRVGFGQMVTIYRVTPSQLLAAAANAQVQTEIVGKTAYWLAGTHASNNLSRTLALVRPRG